MLALNIIGNTKISVEINENETKKAIQHTNDSKSWFLKRIYKIDKSLVSLTKKGTKRPKSMQLEVKMVTLQKNISKIQKIISNFFESLDANNLEYSEEMDRFAGTCELPKLNQDIIKMLNNSVTSSEIEAIIIF